MLLKSFAVNKYVQTMLLLVALSFSANWSSAATIVPASETTSHTIQEPLWKSQWDEARRFTRKQQFEQAAQLYHQVLAEKPQLQIAKLEYCQVLIELHKYDEAKNYLFQLREYEPENKNLDLMAGLIAFEEGDYQAAIRLLQPLYDKDNRQDSSGDLLEKLIVAYRSVGNSEKLYALLSTKFERNKNDKKVLMALAKTAQATGRIKDAQMYYLDLVRFYPSEETLVVEATDFLERNGMHKDSAETQEKYLKSHPGFVPFRKKLIQYYFAEKDTSSALLHLNYLMDHGLDADGEFALKAARVYRDQENKLEKALQLFETYFQRHTDKKEIHSEITQIRHLIAKNLLQLIETNKATAYIQDLDKLTIDRVAIYKILAEELEKTNKKQALINILEKLKTDPEKGEEYVLQLARLYNATGEYTLSLQAYKAIHNPVLKTFAYYQERAALEEKFDRPDDAQISYSEALKLQPNNKRILKEYVKMLGDFGYSRELLELGKSSVASAFSKNDIGLILQYAEFLGDNGMFSEAYPMYERLLSDSSLGDDEKTDVRYRQLMTLRKESKFNEAEEILRLLILKHPEKYSLWLDAVQLNLIANNTADAWKWFNALLARRSIDDWKTHIDDFSQKVFEQYIHLKLAAKEFPAAIQELEVYLAEVKKAQQVEPLSLVKLLARLYITIGSSSRAVSLLEPYTSPHDKDLEFEALLVIAEESRESGLVKENRQTIPKITTDKCRIFLLAAKICKEIGKGKVALGFLDKAEAIHPHSQRVFIERAATSHALGRLDDARALYSQLIDRYPDERYFLTQFKDILFALKDDEALSSMLSGNEAYSLDDSDRLLKARLLWREGKTEESFAEYEMLTSGSFKKEFQAETNSSYTDFPERKPKAKSTIWDIFSFSGPEEIEWLEKMTDPVEFSKNISATNSPLVTSYYTRFKAERSTRIEYLARKALSDKKYKTAEKQYRQVLQTENSQVALEDLAKVYERLGEYGREAEIYTALVEQGRKDSKIEESIQRNTLVRAPQISIDTQTLSKEGREGVVNIQKNSVALNYRYMPTVSSELNLREEEIFYSSKKGDNQNVSGRKMSSTGNFELIQGTVVKGDIGLHAIDDFEYKKILYDVGVEQKFDEMLKGFFSFTSSTINDSIRSLEKGISKHGMLMGVMLENQSGFNIGAQYSRQNYVDDNMENKLNMWSSFSIYSEYTTIEFKYEYELQKQTDSNYLIANPTTGNFHNSLSYWSPGDYWSHTLHLKYKHLLRDLDFFKDMPASYYDFNVSAGYESANSMIYSGQFDIFLELSTHYLLKGTTSIVHSDFYDETLGSLSLVYRW